MARGKSQNGRRRGCVVINAVPPTIINPDGTYVRFSAPVPVKVCKRYIEFPGPDSVIRITKTALQKQARKYAELSRTLPCPTARQLASQLHVEWSQFAKTISRVK